MPNRIRILHLEDEPRDSELVEQTLVSEGLQIVLFRVDDEDAFLRALRSDGFDLILSDYSLPGFDGPRALALAKELRPDLPFLFVSGTMGEELAVESLKQGAMDYVLKGLLTRLPSSVDRAFKEMKAIRARAEAERQVRAQRDELEKMNARLMENQAQLIQSEKMATIGLLSAGIAHEINNPMAYVTMNLEMLAEYAQSLKPGLEGFLRLIDAIRKSPDASVRALPEIAKVSLETRNLADIGSDLDALLSETRAGAERVNAIVKSLNRMARVDKSELEPTDVHECLEDALKLASNEIRYRCVVQKDFGNLPLIHAHPGQLKQVFLNLVVNAAQAMERGNVFIRTGAGEDRIRIEIEDEGSGIPQENLARLFTPFFTTKPPGKGTGLGLSISQGIIRNLGGDIQVESQVGKGSRFTVSIPTGGPSPE